MLPKELEDYTGRMLDVDSFRDYCPNGMQIEGNRKIKKIATGVSASLEFVEQAIGWGADALLVHHGYFWKNEDQRIIGIKKNRIALLLQHEISLFAYHLPLDAHPEIGNNAQFGKLFALSEIARFGEQNIAMIGEMNTPLMLTEFSAMIEAKLGRKPQVVGANRLLKKIAWCSGAAQDYLLQAAALGADAYVSGEISERTYYEAREAGVIYISAGHHAGEKLGVRALGEHLAQHFALEHQFFDTGNPV